MEKQLSKAEQQYRKKVSKDELKLQIISFAMMIALTIIAFIVIGTKSISSIYFMPFLLFLAIVQVVLQLYYLMHLKEKGHNVIQLFLFAGSFIVIIVLFTFVLDVWV